MTLAKRAEIPINWYSAIPIRMTQKPKTSPRSLVLKEKSYGALRLKEVFKVDDFTYFLSKQDCESEPNQTILMRLRVLPSVTGVNKSCDRA